MSWMSEAVTFGHKFRAHQYVHAGGRVRGEEARNNRDLRQGRTILKVCRGQGDCSERRRVVKKKKELGKGAWRPSRLRKGQTPVGTRTLLIHPITGEEKGGCDGDSP